MAEISENRVPASVGNNGSPSCMPNISLTRAAYLSSLNSASGPVSPRGFMIAYENIHVASIRLGLGAIYSRHLAPHYVPQCEFCKNHGTVPAP